MKRSEKVKITRAAHKIGSVAIAAGVYLGTLLFVGRCNIEDDGLFFGMIGIMTVFNIMMWMTYWATMGEQLDKEYYKKYKFYKKREQEMFIKRKQYLEEKAKRAENVEVHNHWNIETDDNGNITNIYRNKKN